MRSQSGATCDPSNGTNGITIDATILALTQSFVVNNYGDGGGEGNLTVYGSVQQFARGPVGTFNSGSYTLSSGYQKQYTWDPLLDFVSPPSYLVPSNAAWSVSSINSSAGNTSTSVCPALLPIYGSTIYITQYCSAATTGLPKLSVDHRSVGPHSGVRHGQRQWDGHGQLDRSAVQQRIGHHQLRGVLQPVLFNLHLQRPQRSECGLDHGDRSGTGRHLHLLGGTTNASGTSNPSPPSASMTMPNLPSAATNVAASTNANGTVTVAWTDPANNGSPITSYSVTPTPACSGCTYTSLTGASVASTVVTGLTRVRATPSR